VDDEDSSERSMFVAVAVVVDVVVELCEFELLSDSLRG